MLVGDLPAWLDPDLLEAGLADMGTADDEVLVIERTPSSRYVALAIVAIVDLPAELAELASRGRLYPARRVLLVDGARVTAIDAFAQRGERARA